MKTKQIKYYIVIFNAIFMLSVFSAYGQENFSGNDVKCKNYLKLSATGSLYLPLNIASFGEKVLSSSSMPSSEASIYYSRSLKNNFGVNIGLSFSVAPYIYKYNGVKTAGFYSNSFRKADYSQNIYALPISLQKSIPFKNKQNIHHLFELGVKANYVNTESYKTAIGVATSPTADDMKIFEMQMYGKQKLFLSGFAKYGLQFAFKNESYMQCSFVLQYSPSEIRAGRFEFSNSPFVSYGQVSQKVNYVGVELGYAFPLKK